MKTRGDKMAISGFDERQREIREYHKEYSWFYRVLGGLIMVGVTQLREGSKWDEPSRAEPQHE
jgi:hypothetical protein